MASSCRQPWRIRGTRNDRLASHSADVQAGGRRVQRAVRDRDTDRLVVEFYKMALEVHGGVGSRAAAGAAADRTRLLRPGRARLQQPAWTMVSRYFQTWTAVYVRRARDRVSHL